MRPAKSERWILGAALAAAACALACAAGSEARSATAAPSPTSGPTCEAGQERANGAAVSVKIVPMRRDPSAEVVIPLDNRGYRYDAPQGPADIQSD